MAILPIVTYNDPILREKTKPVTETGEALDRLIEEMFETMYGAGGVGLAAPQIGRTERLFVIDAGPLLEETEDPDPGPMVFINPEIVDTGGEDVGLEEGCLSIPDVRDTISRPSSVTVHWLDRTMQEREETFNGWLARVIQHEADHLEGRLFIDYLSAFRRRLHQTRLNRINAGEIEAGYPVVSKSPIDRT